MGDLQNMLADLEYGEYGGNGTTFNLELFLQQSNITMPQPDHDQYKRDLLTYYLLGLGGMTICCLGLVGNILSLLVLTRKKMRSSTYSYLSALSVCDCLVLIFTIVLLVKDVHKPQKGQHRWPWDEGLYPYLFPYVHPLAFSFQVTSIWLTLAFTVDRYIMICHPFKAEPFCTISRARKVIVGIFIGGVIFNIAKFFEYQTVIIHLPMHNQTRVGCDLTTFGRSHIFRELYHSWLYIVFVSGVPFATLAVLNAFLIYAVHQSRQRGKEINAAEKKRNDTTIMLIGVVITFFICQTPALVSRVIWAFEHDPKAFKRLPLYTLNESGNFLIICNSAINIVPYYFFGHRFRQEFKLLFCQCFINGQHFDKMRRTLSLTMNDKQHTPPGGSTSLMLKKRSSNSPPISSPVKGGPPVADSVGTEAERTKLVEPNGHCVTIDHHNEKHPPEGPAEKCDTLFNGT